MGFLDDLFSPDNEIGQRDGQDSGAFERENQSLAESIFGPTAYDEGFKSAAYHNRGEADGANAGVLAQLGQELDDLGNDIFDVDDKGYSKGFRNGVKNPVRSNPSSSSSSYQSSSDDSRVSGTDRGRSSSESADFNPIGPIIVIAVGAGLAWLLAAICYGVYNGVRWGWKKSPSVLVAGAFAILIVGAFLAVPRTVPVEELLRSDPSNAELWKRALMEWQGGGHDAHDIVGAMGMYMLVRAKRAPVDDESLIAALKRVGPLDSGFYGRLAKTAAVTSGRATASAILNEGVRRWPNDRMLLQVQTELLK